MVRQPAAFFSQQEQQRQRKSRSRIIRATVCAQFRPGALRQKKPSAGRGVQRGAPAFFSQKRQGRRRDRINPQHAGSSVVQRSGNTPKPPKTEPFKSNA